MGQTIAVEETAGMDKAVVDRAAWDSLVAAGRAGMGSQVVAMAEKVGLAESKAARVALIAKMAVTAGLVGVTVVRADLAAWFDRPA